MNNNIKYHISDSADSVFFSGPDWPSSVETVSDALNEIAPWALTVNGLPIATETVPGIIRIATAAEASAGTSNNTVITPNLLRIAMQTPQATESIVGNTRYATSAEALALSINTAAITPSKLGHVIANKGSTEAARGTIRISTAAQALSGTDDTTAMTPLKTKQAIAHFSEAWGTATESSDGVVRLATVAQALAGVLRDGYAVSPYTLSRMAGTESSAGLFKVATNSQTLALADNTVVITPAKLAVLNATSTQKGLVRLLNTESSQANTALSANAQVLYRAGGTMTGNINFTENNQGILWNRNTDLAAITFKNDSDADTNSYLLFAVGDNNNEYFRWTTRAGGVDTTIATLRPGGNLWLAGNIDINDMYVRCDARLKTDIQPIKDALAKIDSLDTGIYTKHKSLTDDTVIGKEAGIFAQQLQKVLPEGVKTLDDGTLTVSPMSLIALLIEANKELKSRLEKLEEKI
ncbi:tail collar fiber protein [Aeromonas phage Aes012]|uniref:Long tail fiber protein Gp37 n=2 Tax=Tulanevirus TaxID=2560244 RepID=J7KIE8_9CAUD|nr:tail collar fiber protein [Aeromonas phage Aes508]YP_007677863.1 tail collar fiber protein [Aeromonas phage Aes012]AFN69776.1 short tail fiber protein [Aeromonas phage Aes012]AFQ97217.1 short tail fibers [Aeromonas phage Aes508]